MKIHLIGIGGTGMGSLAGLLRAAGHDVRGSDEHLYPPMSTQLAEQQIPVMEGFGPQNLEWAPERVVVGNVCRKDHVEVLAAQERGIPLASFPSLLEELFLTQRRSLVVAGTHGKTTTSSLLAHVLTEAGRDPSFLIGGVPLNFRQSWRLGAGKEFVVEGDEYDTAFFDKKSKFLHYRPQLAILTSVEFDHADIFADEEAVKAAFREFVALIPPDGDLVVCSAFPDALEVARSARCRVTTYGRPGTGAEWSFEVAGPKPGGRTLVRLSHNGRVAGTLETGLPGAYNLENLLGVTVAALRSDLDLSTIARGVHRFLGVKRRQEVRGIAAGVTVVDDFAHHPTAIRETLQGLKGRHGPGKIFAAFEPRSATSRRNVFQTDFVGALANADEVVLAPLYSPEKVPAADRLDVERLAADLRTEDVPARLIPTVAETVDHLASRAAAGDTVVIMSSGDYGGLHDKLLARLGNPVRPALPEDRPKISALLNRLGIPHPLLAQFWPHYLVIPAPDDQSVIGCVAVERVLDVALLRMLAVTPERRGEGLGYLLVETGTNKARSEGVLRLYLVTDGAQGFFGEKLGFEAIDRKDVDSALQSTVEYQMPRNKTATWMRKVLLIAAAIVAGGRATRLGGVPKGTLLVGGRRIVDRQLEVLRAVFPRVFLVASDPAPWRDLGVAVIPDRVPGAGPLAGIDAALSALTEDESAVACVAGDMPFLTVPALELLRDHAPAAPLVAAPGQPLFARYARACAPALQRALAEGRLQARALLDELPATYLDDRALRAVDPQLAFLANVNTPADLLELNR